MRAKVDRWLEEAWGSPVIMESTELIEDYDGEVFDQVIVMMLDGDLDDISPSEKFYYEDSKGFIEYTIDEFLSEEDFRKLREFSTLINKAYGLWENDAPKEVIEKFRNESELNDIIWEYFINGKEINEEKIKELVQAL